MRTSPGTGRTWIPPPCTATSGPGTSRTSSTTTRCPGATHPTGPLTIASSKPRCGPYRLGRRADRWPRFRGAGQPDVAVPGGSSRLAPATARPPRSSRCPLLRQGHRARMAGAPWRRGRLDPARTTTMASPVHLHDPLPRACSAHCGDATRYGRRSGGALSQLTDAPDRNSRRSRLGFQSTRSACSTQRTSSGRWSRRTGSPTHRSSRATCPWPAALTVVGHRDAGRHHRLRGSVGAAASRNVSHSSMFVHTDHGPAAASAW